MKKSADTDARLFFKVRICGCAGFPAKRACCAPQYAHPPRLCQACQTTKRWDKPGVICRCRMRSATRRRLSLSRSRLLAASSSSRSHCYFIVTLLMVSCYFMTSSTISVARRCSPLLSITPCTKPAAGGSSTAQHQHDARDAPAVFMWGLPDSARQPAVDRHSRHRRLRALAPASQLLIAQTLILPAKPHCHVSNTCKLSWWSRRLRSLATASSGCSSRTAPNTNFATAISTTAGRQIGT